MDVLSDVLTTVRLQSEIRFCPELRSPWGIEFPEQSDRAVFYLLSRGSCYLELEGQPPVPLVGGDLAMLPQGAAHVLRDRPETPAIPIEEFVRRCQCGERIAATETSGAGSQVVAGDFRFGNQAAARLLAPMPPLIHFRAEFGQTVPWLEATLKFLASECTSETPGAQIVTERLSDVLFIQILRAFIALDAREGRNCGRHTGMLRALMDPQIGRALALIHERPQHPWTVAELAQKVHMSRTGFAVRFPQLAGVTPLAYLTRWRMQKASNLLSEDEENLDAIAQLVGYDSTAAFSKAFKREMGVAPGLYRRSNARRS